MICRRIEKGPFYRWEPLEVRFQRRSLGISGSNITDIHDPIPPGIQLFSCCNLIESIRLQIVMQNEAVWVGAPIKSDGKFCGLVADCLLSQVQEFSIRPV